MGQPVHGRAIHSYAQRPLSPFLPDPDFVRPAKDRPAELLPYFNGRVNTAELGDGAMREPRQRPSLTVLLIAGVRRSTRTPHP